MPSELKNTAFETGVNACAAFALIEVEPEAASRPGTSAASTDNPGGRFFEPSSFVTSRAPEKTSLPKSSYRG